MKTPLTLLLALIVSASVAQVHKHVDSVAKTDAQTAKGMQFTGQYWRGDDKTSNPQRDTIPVYILKVAHVDSIHNTTGSLQILGYDKISTLEFYSHANMIWIKAYTIREEQLATFDRWILGEKIPMEFQTIGYLYADKKTPITEKVYMSFGR